MKKSNLLSVAMMISSIVLLLLLQTLWLVNSYDQAYNDLRRHTSDLFRNTVMEMRDSIFIRGFEGAVDTLPKPGGAVFFSLDHDTARSSDSTRLNKSVFHARTEILVRGAVTDSAKYVLNKFSNASGPNNRGKIVIKFAPDSLRSDSIRRYFEKVLAQEEITLPFKIKVDKPEFPRLDSDVILGSSRLFTRELTLQRDEVIAEKGAIMTEWVRFAPGLRYSSVFENVRPYLYMEIGPQILFSVALTLITSAAFFMMYRSMRSQQKLMELKNDFISNITHELKTPVTTVSVALEALRNFKGLENPKTTREYLDIAQGELNRLALLTDKVLKAAAFDNRGVSFEKEQVDLHKTVDQILHSMKLIFEKQKANVTFEQQGNSFTIHGGSVHLTNVIYNLLDNALKYSFGEPQISVRLEEDANRVVLKVSDKGMGIPAEYKKKIFEKFFRVPTGDVHNIKGYGLGLSYVDSVVRSHKGLIEVVSKPGEGSVFTISLPKGM